MEELAWPASAGAVQGAAEVAVDDQWSGDVVAAAQRLPDNGTYLDIDELWADLDPLLKDIVHNT